MAGLNKQRRNPPKIWCLAPEVAFWTAQNYPKRLFYINTIWILKLGQ
jgi:hypothetical protein